MKKFAETYLWAGHRWSKIWLAVGVALAVVLLWSSLSNYVFVSRRVMMDQLQREMNRRAAAIESELREKGRFDARAAVDTLVAHEGYAWAQAAMREGVVLARAGLDLSPTFSAEELHSRLTAHEPVAVIRDTEQAGYVVTAIPLFVPPASASEARGDGPSLVILELAMPLDRARTAVWPVRERLILNCAAGLALLASLLLIAMRFRAHLRGEQVQHQVQIARQVQQALLPASDSAWPHAVVAARYTAAEQVGGDFYDLFPASPGRLAVVIGDVAGKGIPAALLMGVIHGAVRSSDWTSSATRHEEASRRLNRLLCERSGRSNYSTMFWACYDGLSSELKYINAGHCPPLLLRAGGEISRLGEGGPVLGLLPTAGFEQTSTWIGSGDLLVLYSDGIVEAANAAGEEFGETRLENVLMRNRGEEPCVVRERVLEAVREFLGGGQPQDDLTLLVVEFQPAHVAEEDGAAAMIQSRLPCASSVGSSSF